MSIPLKIFIGYDPREAVAYHVLEHSLQTRSSIPLQICPLNRTTLSEFYQRAKGPLDSTDFAISRFAVPFLCGYKGWALFMDCDMLCRGDVAEMAGFANIRNWYKSLLVVKHDYTPKGETKFLGENQTKYQRKNWSSVMFFNNERCKKLTPEYIQSAHGLGLHQFTWTTDDQIGELPKTWNWLVEEYPYNDEAKLVHYTLGGPYFGPQFEGDYADEWWTEHGKMNYAEQQNASS